MINKNIIAQAEGMKIADKFDWKRVKQFKKEPPKFLREAVDKNEMVILGDGDLKNYYQQPLMVIPINDFMGMLLTCQPPKKRRWRKQRPKDESKQN